MYKSVSEKRMNKANMLDSINKYVRNVNKLLPYPKSVKNSILENLEQDLIEAMKDTSDINPVEVFGDPSTVAKNLCSSQDWGLSTAGFGIRTVAYIIDFCLSLAIFFCFLIPVFLVGPYAMYETNPVFVIVEFFILVLTVSSGIFVFFCYPILLEGLFSTTIGKKLFGLKVVDVSGIKITWKQAIIRNLPKTQAEFLFFDVFIGKYMYKTIHQRALDKVAETLVIR